MAQLIVADDAADLASRSAALIARHIDEALPQHGNVMVCLTGGHTPRHLYEALGDPAGPWRPSIEWPRLHLFWGDERHVPPDHPDSNFRMAREALLRHVPVPEAQIHRMRGEEPDPAAAAAEYDAELRRAFAAAGRTATSFDLMLLGIGADAHIASIFPSSPLLAPSEDAGAGAPGAAAVYVPRLEAWRITLTPAAILESRSILVLAAGRGKAEAIRHALEGETDVRRWPAQLLRAARNRVTWVVDRGAASMLTRSASA